MAPNASDPGNTDFSSTTGPSANAKISSLRIRKAAIQNTRQKKIRREHPDSKETWTYFRRAEGQELERNSTGHAIRYCQESGCNWSTVDLTLAKKHLQKKHNIILAQPPPEAMESRQQITPEAMESRQQITNITNIRPVAVMYPRFVPDEDVLQREKERVLKGAIGQDALNIALARLITGRKLPHDAVEWPELQKLLVAANHTVEAKLEQSRSVVPLIIEGAVMEVSKPKKPRSKLHDRPMLQIFQTVEDEEKAYQRAKEKVLRSAVRQDDLNTALAHLILVRNLPYEAVEWEELQGLLIVVNRTVEPKLVKSRRAVPKLLQGAVKKMSIDHILNK